MTTDQSSPDRALPHLMRAAVLDRFGGPEELTMRQIPIPTVSDSDVLIRVHFAGVASWDADERRGEYDGAFGIQSTFPYVLGWDAAGIVAAVGRDVTHFEVGDRVYAATIPVPHGGAYAEYCVVQEEHVAHVPANLSSEQAGVMAWDALTALSGLNVLDPKSGGSLMIFGASGGIGHMAVQFALQRGFRVLAVASGRDGVALCEALGAQIVVDGHADDVPAAVTTFAPDGLDAALVTSGGPVAERALKGVKRSGIILWPNGVNPTPSTFLLPSVTLYDADRSRAALDELNASIATGSFAPHLSQRFSFDQIQAAHESLEKHYVGKYLLEIPHS